MLPLAMMSSISNPSSTTILKTLALLALLLIIINVHFSFSNQPNSFQTDFSYVTTRQYSSSPSNTTNVSHLVFGLLGSVKTWHYRKPFIESWWRPNITRGYVYLDRTPTDDLLPWSGNYPPFRISDNTTKLLRESHHVSALMVRMVHAVIEVSRDEQEGVRWYIMADDDTIFFVDNLADELSKYDHNKYIYIGCHSECVMLNQIFSYDMGFGGAGLIMSYALTKMVQKNIEDCFKRYPYFRSADLILMTCVNDFGVSLTVHPGLHQIDLQGDASGLLSAHPKVPLLSLHHLEHVDPLFRSMDSFESTKHLMKAANVDQPRMLQQTIYHTKTLNWTFSISWGYSVHVYENIIPYSILKTPLETFRPWGRWKPPLYIFNTRPVLNDSCATPHMFLFQSVKKINGIEAITSYTRMASRGLESCGLGGNHSADSVSRIEVVSPMTKPTQNGKTECCDVVDIVGMEVAKLKLRDCMEDELIA